MDNAGMFNLPSYARLGEASAITITSADLDRSLAFYQKLGFHEVMHSDSPYPWVLVSDGTLLILLRMDSEQYCALTYFQRSADLVKELEDEGIVFTARPDDDDKVKKYLFTSPDGLNISLVTLEGFQKPLLGPAMLGMSQQDYFDPDKYVNKVCGMFAEFCHPVANLDESISFWEDLGFVVLSRYESPYPWAIVSDGLSTVGLHQSTHFSYPAITYFASDMEKRIEKLTEGGLQDITVFGGRGNVIVKTPEDQRIFLFKLGM